MVRKKAPPQALEQRVLKRTYIAQWRTFRGLNQIELAAKVEEILGMSFSNSKLSRIEGALTPYGQSDLEAIAKALDCTTLDLQARNPMNPDDPIAAFATLDEKDQQRAADFIFGLKKTFPKPH